MLEHIYAVRTLLTLLWSFVSAHLTLFLNNFLAEPPEHSKVLPHGCQVLLELLHLPLGGGVLVGEEVGELGEAGQLRGERGEGDGGGANVFGVCMYGGCGGGRLGLGWRGNGI